jgi:hypothetical protein
LQQDWAQGKVVSVWPNSLPWNTTELLVHLQQKISLVEEATKALDAIHAAITPLKEALIAFGKTLES